MVVSQILHVLQINLQNFNSDVFKLYWYWVLAYAAGNCYQTKWLEKQEK